MFSTGEKDSIAGPSASSDKKGVKQISSGIWENKLAALVGNPTQDAISVASPTRMHGTGLKQRLTWTMKELLMSKRSVSRCLQAAWVARSRPIQISE